MNLRLTSGQSLFSLFAVIAVVPLSAMAAPELVVGWYTLDGGGVQSSTGEAFELAGTLGQFDARNQPMGGGNLTLTAGFWVIPQCPLIPGDYDGDCDVDHADYISWEVCASGPAVLYVGNCSDTDFDMDLDTDQEDFSVFQRCYSGENNPGDPNCKD